MMRIQTTVILVLGIALMLACSGVLGAEKGKVDLNRAATAELESLPGIGPALAKRIVDYRERNGPFRRIEELMDVPGIGEKKFLALRDLIRVEAPAPKPKE